MAGATSGSSSRLTTSWQAATTKFNDKPAGDRAFIRDSPAPAGSSLNCTGHCIMLGQLHLSA